MTKIPKHIISKAQRIALDSYRSRLLTESIIQWLIEQGISREFLESGDCDVMPEQLHYNSDRDFCRGEAEATIRSIFEEHKLWEERRI